MNKECEHWERPEECVDCNPPIPIKMEKRCSHKGLCLSDYSCGDGDLCCLTMKRVFHSILECMDIDGGCEIWDLKLCPYHIGKVAYLFKKHEYDSL